MENADDFMGVATLIIGVFGAITAALAARKGYNPWAWFFAASIIGLIVLAFLPFPNTPDLWESEQIERKKRGNTIGGILSGVLIAFGILRAFGY